SLPRHDQRVDHLAQLLNTHIAAVEQLQLVVEEADIEWGVVDDQFGAANEVQQLLDHMAEQRLIGDHFIGDAVHLHRPTVDFALWIDVLMKMPACEPAVDQFDTADFDQTVALAGFQTGCFGVEHDLPHSYSSNVYAWARNSSMPRFASASASSFSRWPLWPLTQCHCTMCFWLSSSRRCHRSTFLTGAFAAVRQPRRFHESSHSLMPRRTYSESVVSVTSQGSLSVASASIAAVSSMRLLVVSASPP